MNSLLPSVSYRSAQHALAAAIKRREENLNKDFKSQLVTEFCSAFDLVPWNRERSRNVARCLWEKIWLDHIAHFKHQPTGDIWVVSQPYVEPFDPERQWLAVNGIPWRDLSPWAWYYPGMTMLFSFIISKELGDCLIKQRKSGVYDRLRIKV